MASGVILDGPDVWAEWSVRAALHNLLNAPAGFAPWAALEVLHLQLRLLQAPGQTRKAPMHVALDVLRMTALRPFVFWSKPVSWRGALAQQPCLDADEHKLWVSTFAPLCLQGQLGGKNCAERPGLFGAVWPMLARLLPVGLADDF